MLRKPNLQKTTQLVDKLKRKSTNGTRSPMQGVSRNYFN